MGDKVNYLFEPEGTELHWDGLKEKAAPMDGGGASLSGPAPKYSQPMAVKRHPDDRSGLAGTRPADKAMAPRQLSPEQMLAQANEMLNTQKAQHEAQLSSGPSVGARDDAGGKLPDWLVAQAGSDDDRAMAYQPKPRRAVSKDEALQYMKNYKFGDKTPGSE